MPLVLVILLGSELLSVLITLLWLNLKPGVVARGIFRPHKNSFFSIWHISWNYSQTVHLPFATFLPLI